MAFLKCRFGNDVRLDPTSRKFAFFDATNAEVGEVVVEEDGNELIVSIGDITHGHFGSYEFGLSAEERQEIIAESLVDFLVDLFEDKYFLFRSDNSGGWARFDMVKESDMQSANTQWFKWPGPLRRETQSR